MRLRFKTSKIKYRIVPDTFYTRLFNELRYEVQYREPFSFKWKCHNANTFDSIQKAVEYLFTLRQDTIIYVD